MTASDAEAKAAVAAMFDRSAATYEDLGAAYFGPMGRALVSRAAITRGSRVLDVGCGRGAVLFPAAEATGPSGSVVGIDLAPGMVERTAAAAAHLPWVTVALGDAAEPDFPDGSFDVVLAGLVLFFLPSPETALANYRRLLRPGGKLVFSTFAAQDPLLSAVVRALTPLVPPEAAERPVDRFKDTSSISAFLGDWDAVAYSGQPIETSFTGKDHLWTWFWSHGMRAFLEAVPADRLEEAEAIAYRVMDAAAGPDGRITLHTTVRITTAICRD
ncbi:class I SAM-dependent methyltransferase [Actinocorallia sp. A-T 12471]|uniref:class I SAM-dependent methyltransferase n=1 Tax=Actinocorallia sp. A-T 12471 TaxID=3089813 RepID=UPI0029D26A8C|nr:methyltransferase domain-containing protein [Actinocorallia sp. A-T 12471]MDX6739495.1 methyltransferase domain-containing protein [Actinocorallia sp. A-T 12471]